LTHQIKAYGSQDETATSDKPARQVENNQLK